MRGKGPRGFRRAAARRAAALGWAAALVSASAAVGAAQPEPQEDRPARTVAQALREGKLGLHLRYRYENVSDDTPAVAGRDGRASTLRTTLSYRTASWHRLSLFVEFEDVSDVGMGDLHNNGGAPGSGNGVTDRPVIADPEGTEVNQLYIRYSALPGTRIEAGRMLLALADERFVGPVGWRQNFQTFDGVRIRQTSLERVAFDYAYVRNANRIFRDDKGMDTHLLDVSFELGDLGRAGSYLYRLDYDDASDAGLSTTTYGARWSGEVALAGAWSLPFHAELARQRDAADNPARVDAGYARLEAGAKRKTADGSWWLQAGLERLGGGPAAGRFTTPLATLHKFNGWADRFLVTPPDGLRDLALALGARRGSLEGLLVYHDFQADFGGASYGTEVDAQLSYRAPWKQTFAVKLARYDTEGFGSDVAKFWLWTAYEF